MENELMTTSKAFHIQTLYSITMEEPTLGDLLYIDTKIWFDGVLYDIITMKRQLWSMEIEEENTELQNKNKI